MWSIFESFYRREEVKFLFVIKVYKGQVDNG